MKATDEVGLANGEHVSTTIAREVAAREGVDPTTLTPRLGEIIDPDALDTLFSTDDIDGTLEFTYCGHRVVVRSDDGVTVEGPRPPASESGSTTAGATSDVD